MGRKFALRPVILLRVLFLLVLLGVILYVLFVAQWRPRDLDDAKRDLELFGVWAPAVAIAVQAVGIVFLVPGFLLILATAVIFGKNSIWISLCGQLLGAVLCYYIAKGLGRDFMRSLLGQRVMTIERILQEHGFRYLLYLRLLSVVPLPLLAYGPGLVRIRLRDVALATLLGSGPFIVVLGLFGDSLARVRGPSDLAKPQFLFPVLLLLVLVSFPLVIAMAMRRARRRRIAGTAGPGAAVSEAADPAGPEADDAGPAGPPT